MVMYSNPRKNKTKWFALYPMQRGSLRLELPASSRESWLFGLPMMEICRNMNIIEYCCTNLKNNCSIQSRSGIQVADQWHAIAHSRPSKICGYLWPADQNLLLQYSSVSSQGVSRYHKTLQLTFLRTKHIGTLHCTWFKLEKWFAHPAVYQDFYRMDLLTM